MQWPQSPAEWIELLLTATAPPAAPIIVDRFSAALPFLNPQISDEMAIIAAALSFVGGVGTLQFTKHGQALEIVEP